MKHLFFFLRPSLLNCLKYIWIWYTISFIHFFLWRSMKWILNSSCTLTLFFDSKGVSHNIIDIQFSLFRKWSFFGGKHSTWHHCCGKGHTIWKSIEFGRMSYRSNISWVLIEVHMRVFRLQGFWICIWIHEIHSIWNEGIDSWWLYCFVWGCVSGKRLLFFYNFDGFWEKFLLACFLGLSLRLF